MLKEAIREMLGDIEKELVRMLTEVGVPNITDFVIYDFDDNEEVWKGIVNTESGTQYIFSVDTESGKCKFKELEEKVSKEDF